MSDLINKKTAIERAEACTFTDKAMKRQWMDWLKYCLDAPTIEAVPVVHGEWVGGKWWKECSECSEVFTPTTKEPNFCPECGADMRKKV